MGMEKPRSRFAAAWLLIAIMSLIILPIGSPQLPASAVFPLQISANSRYFQSPNGTPFFFMMDAGWEAAVQLTNAQIDQYLNDRKNRGFTAIILEMAVELYSSQQPTYQNAYGYNPFSTINNTGNPYYLATTCDFSTQVNAYWNTVDYVIQGAYNRGMAVVAFPAYTGYPTTPAQGWYTPIMADTAAHLQNFGAFIAGRYGRYGNIIWGMAGDNSLSQSDLDQHWNIALGMQSILGPNPLTYCKGQRYPHNTGIALINANGGVSRYPGFNVNNAYSSNCAANGYTQVSVALTEYARSPVYPFFVDENDYEGNGSCTANDIRLALYGPALSGACGHCFGDEQLWGFGCANNLIANGPAATLASSLNTTGAQHSTIFAQVMQQYAWWKLVPKTDTSLVTTALGSGASTISPALSSDGTFAMIYTAGGTGFTVALSALSVSSFRARWYDPTNGTFTTASGSPFSNSGTNAFTTPGNNAAGDPDWLLVLG